MLHLQSRPALWLLPAIATGLVACGGGDPSSPTNPDDPDEGLFTEVACGGLSLSSLSGAIPDEIPIGTLPASFASPVAAVLTGAEGEVLGLTYVTPDEADALQLAVPLHPATPLSGGTVTLTFTDGTVACAPVDFTILPLPASDGEFAVVVDLLQATLAEQMAPYQITPEELNATALADMSPALWPLAIVQSLVDHPANEASLRAIAEGGMGDEALDWLDRLMARSSLRESLEAATTGAVAYRAAERGPATAASDLLCRPEFVNTAEQLSSCMVLAAEVTRSATGLSREASKDILLLFSGLSQIGLPLAGEIKVVLGAVFWLIYSERESVASLYPTQLTTMDAAADPGRLLEDQDSGILTATVHAANLGYDLQNEILGGISQAKSLINTFGTFDFSTGTQLDTLARFLAPQFAARLGDLRIEDLYIPSELFGPVTLADTLFLEVRVLSGDAVEFSDTSSALRYEGRRPGITEVSVRTRDGAFGGAQVADQIEIEVGALQVSIAPDEVFVGAGQPWEFIVTVIGSAHPDSVVLDTLASPMQGRAEISYNFDGTHTVVYTAPDVPVINEPDLLTVRHVAESGARGYTTVERLDIATIRFGGVRIVTGPTCLDPGATLLLEAVVPGVENPELVWSVTAGSISQSGFFTAPAQAELVVVTVAYAADESVKDELQLQVGGCSCQASVSVDGQDAGATRVARFFLSDDLSAVTSIDWGGGVLGPEQSSALVSTFGGDIDNPGSIPVGTTTSVSAFAGGLLLGTAWRNPDDFDAPSFPPVELTISANDGGNLLEGTVSGQVGLLDGAEFRAVPFSMTFHIEADPAYSDATTRVCRIE